MLVQLGLIFGVVVVLMVLKVPIGFAFGVGATIMVLVFNVDPEWVISTSFDLQMSYAFLALPLYLLLGSVLDLAKMGDRVSDFVVTAIGRLKGGLGIALVVTCGLFGAVSGLAMSALVSIGRGFLPAAERQGYPIPYTTGLLVSSAILAILIPPSGNMILFGFMGRLPISLCFLAPLIPGVILMFFLSAVHLYMARSIPSIRVPPKTTFKNFTVALAKSGYRNSLTLFLPFIVLGGIYGGIMTPTEAASVGTIYAFLVGWLIYRKISMRDLGNSLFRTGLDIGSIMALGFFGLVMSKVIIIKQVTEALLVVMLAISEDPMILLMLINVLMVIMGMFMGDAISTILAAIILLPIVRAIGFDPYHFAALAGVNLGMGMITPPVAGLLYIGGYMAGGLPLWSYFKYVWKYIVFAFLPTIALTILFPQLSTYLPHLFMRGG